MTFPFAIKSNTFHPYIYSIYFSFESLPRVDLEHLLLYTFLKTFFSHLLIQWKVGLLFVIFSILLLNLVQSKLIFRWPYYQPYQIFLDFTLDLHFSFKSFSHFLVQISSFTLFSKSEICRIWYYKCLPYSCMFSGKLIEELI